MLTSLTLLTILGCGIMAGILFAFSVSVMNALGRLPASQGIAVMQAINVAILNPLFLLVFLGSTLLCLMLAGTALFILEQAGAMWRLLGAALYVLGVTVLTLRCHVPLNNALAQADPSSLAGAALWQDYRRVWTHWNHLRTLAAIGATVSLLMALLG
jgi:uncharacterized membrane protein